VLVISLLVSTLTFNVQQVKTEKLQNDKMETEMLPSTLDWSASRETLKYPSLMKTEDGKRNSTNSWISFEDEESPKPPQVQILRSDEQACIVTITTYGIYKERLIAEGEEFEKITIPENGFTNEPGKPQLPTIRGLIEIPPGKNVSLTVNPLSSIKVNTLCSLELSEYEQLMIYPAQEPISEYNDGVKKSVFQFDREFYSLDDYYPNQLASVSPPTQLRDHTLVQLSIYPIRFNPASRWLNVSNNIEIKLEYYDTDDDQTMKSNKFSSLAFEDICKTLVWNYDSSKPETVDTESVGYLVISNDAFYSSMLPFVEWKKANGFNVTSIKLSDIDVSANDTDIYNYIHNAYYNWKTPPTYVLLVGDVEYLPTHYGLNDTSEGKTATDHYYACVSGSDYLPDLFVGRLSIKSVSELNNILNKLIGYNGFFNKRATLVSHNGYFENTSDWVYNLLSDEGYTVDKFYYSMDTYRVSDITNALYDGRTIINFRGHGSETGWGTGMFEMDNVLELNNKGKYPIVISCTCLTGRYDCGNCFGETWMKVPEKGAVAFFGSSGRSYKGWNDELCKGVYKAIFNDDLYEFGAITVKAKLYMYNTYGDEFITHLQYEMYNILTDPQLQIRTQHELIVSLEGPTDLEFDRYSILNATVYNSGLRNETDVELFLLINGTVVKNVTIAELVSEMSYTIDYLWVPTFDGIYNITAYTPPVPGENVIINSDTVYSNSKTVYFTVNILPPSVETLTPENKTYTTSSVPLNFTVNEATSWIGYSLDGQANVTITGNTMIVDLAEGSHKILIYAKDTVGSVGYSNTVYFTIDTVPPNITDVSQIPLENNVLPEDEVKVNATVTDNLSGVKTVTLIYAYANSSGTWMKIIDMTNIQGNVWSVTIPAFPHFTNVTYTIIAQDNAGNAITTEKIGYEYQYHVIPEFPQVSISLWFMILTLLVVALGTWRKRYFKRKP
jgi:hypothetical protein